MCTMATKVYHHETRQNENLAKLVMSTFYKLQNKNGTTSEDITKYLQENFGDVWRTSILLSKAEETLSRSAALGFLDKSGRRYAVKLARGACRMRARRRRRCRPRRRRRGCRCRSRSRRRRSCQRKRQRRSCRRRKRKQRCPCSEA